MSATRQTTGSEDNRRDSEAADKDCLACRITGALTFIGAGGYVIYEARKQMAVERQAYLAWQHQSPPEKAPTAHVNAIPTAVRRYPLRSGAAHLLGLSIMALGVYRGLM